MLWILKRTVSIKWPLKSRQVLLYIFEETILTLFVLGNFLFFVVIRKRIRFSNSLDPDQARSKPYQLLACWVIFHALVVIFWLVVRSCFEPNLDLNCLQTLSSGVAKFALFFQNHDQLDHSGYPRIVSIIIHTLAKKGYVHLKGLFWPPLEPKTENCFSPFSFDWFIRRITEVKISAFI